MAIHGLLFALACSGAKLPTPAISRFEIVPSAIEVGETATLKVVYADGNGRVEPAIGPVSSGQDVSLTPASSTTYTLTVTAPTGMAKTAKASLTVKPGLMIQIEGLPAPSRSPKPLRAFSGNTKQAKVARPTTPLGRQSLPGPADSVTPVTTCLGSNLKTGPSLKNQESRPATYARFKFADKPTQPQFRIVGDVGHSFACGCNGCTD